MNLGIVAELIQASPQPAGIARTGIIWKSNAGNGSADHMLFGVYGSDAPAPWPLSMVFRVYEIQHNGYNTNFFWGGPLSAPFDSGVFYYGMHPYPWPQAGSPDDEDDHQEEISEGGDDSPTSAGGVDDNGNSIVVVYDSWIDKGVNVYEDSGTLHLEYYHDLSDITKVITKSITTPTSTLPSEANRQLVFGDAPWNQGKELMSARFRNLKIFTSQMTATDLATEAANDQSNSAATATGISNLWYSNVSPTPSDISDKSGNGNDFAWVNSNTGTLWEE